MTTDRKPEPPMRLHDPTQDPSIAQGIGRGVYLGLGIIAVMFLLLIVFGILSRKRAEADLKQEPAAAGISTVNVVTPQARAPSDEIVLPEDTQAFADAPIFARTSGYVNRWDVDIGAVISRVSREMAGTDRRRIDHGQGRKDRVRIRKPHTLIAHPSKGRSTGRRDGFESESVGSNCGTTALELTCREIRPTEQREEPNQPRFERRRPIGILRSTTNKRQRRN